MSLDNLRAEIQSNLGIEHSPEEDKIEIRPGIYAFYHHTPPKFTMHNFVVQSIGMWLWKYALCPMFEERVRADDLRKTISLCYPDNRIHTRQLGQIINCMRSRSARIQYGDFGRAYGWKWDGKEDLAMSMWLFTKTWIYNKSTIQWNNDTNVAPGNESRKAIEEELMELDFMGVVKAYCMDRQTAYHEMEDI